MALTETAEAETPPDAVQSNLDAFKRWAPHLYGRLVTVKTPNSRLVADDDKLDIEFQGKKFYGGDAEAATQQQLHAFFAEPSRHPINEPDPVKLEGACGDLCASVLESLGQEGIAYDPGHAPADSHFLTVFGIGLGLHIAPLIAHSQAKVVILIETNLEFLYHSLFTTEWAALWDEAEAEGRKIIVLLERDSLTISHKVRNAMQANNPAMLDGIYLYKHYASSILSQAITRIGEEINLTVSGLGFFEDELVMTENAVNNLTRNPSKILSEYHPRRDLPAFIVASGPSVEKDLDFIAEHADRAVIFTLGTALRIALRKGIRPDFHVELENGIGNFYLLEPIAKEHDLSGITLLASVTVHPNSFALFDDHIVFFREQVTSTKIFCGNLKVVKPAGPTVANTGLIGALRMGFREIYFFGVDMGTKVEGRFHAEGSVYDLGFRADPTVASRTFQGNFGGTATGESIFNWSRKVLEGVLLHYHNLAVYNCSDGVRIEGAVPKLSETVKLEGPAFEREAFRREVDGSLSLYTQNQVRDVWQALDWRNVMEQVFGRLDTALGEALARPEQDLAWLDEVYHGLRNASGRTEAISVYLRGTMTLCLGCINWYDRRVRDEADRQRFRIIALEKTRAMLADLRTRLTALLAELDGKIEDAAEENTARGDAA